MAHEIAIKIEVAKYNSFGKLFTRNAQYGTADHLNGRFAYFCKLNIFLCRLTWIFFNIFWTMA